MLKSLPFIPVYARSGGETEYISWQQDCIFVQKGVTASSAGHYVLNTNILSKSSVEKILDVSINEMNEEFEAVKYNLDLGKILREKSSEEIYSYLLSERANLNKYDAWGTVRAEEAKIQLKNLLGDLIHIEEAFICENPSGIAVDILKTLCVHRECTWLAEKLNCKPLSNVHYDDCRYEEELTEDDIEALMYGDLRHWEELIRGFYEDGLCSAELMEAYGIQYLTYDGRDSQEEFAYEFPLDPVYDYDAIENKVRELWENPAKIVKVKVERIISRVRNINGKTFDLDSKEIRNEAMARYSPYGANGKCFCQMCRIVKPQRFIEVNNIELEPEYYLPELRLALCLECSKRFEGYRLNDSIRNSFIQEIKTADTVGKEYIDVPIRQKTIRFTGKHLALVQEILRQKPQ